MRIIGTIESSLLVWSIFISDDHETIYCADGDGMVQVICRDGDAWHVLDQLETVGTFGSLFDALEFGQDRIAEFYPEVFEIRSLIRYQRKP
jgi:hypothetical protein